MNDSSSGSIANSGRMFHTPLALHKKSQLHIKSAGCTKSQFADKLNNFQTGVHSPGWVGRPS
jgi:hypothetical protein